MLLRRITEHVKAQNWFAKAGVWPHRSGRNVLIITAIRSNVPALIWNSCTVNRAGPTFRTNKFNVLRRKVVRGIGRNYNH